MSTYEIWYVHENKSSQNSKTYDAVSESDALWDFLNDEVPHDYIISITEVEE